MTSRDDRDPRDPRDLQPASSTSNPILPLGEAGRDIKVPPGSTLKNVPPDYWHGSAGTEVAYWKKRALSAEERMQLRLIEVAALQARVLELENEAAGKEQL